MKIMTIDNNKIALVILFIFLNQISPIQSIACYTCIDCGDPFNAQSVNVSQSLPVCAYCYKLTVYMSYAPRFVLKECVQTCTEQGRMFGGSSHQINCCSGSFCNNALRMYSWRNLVVLISTLVFIGYIK